MYFVYIMTNRSKTLYIGETNNLMRRVREHRRGIGSGFTTKYKLDRLVYFERFQDVHNAIEHEKRIKGSLRIKKIELVVSVNPSWKDLSEEWYERHQYQPRSAEHNHTNSITTRCPTSTAACRILDSVMPRLGSRIDPSANWLVLSKTAARTLEILFVFMASPYKIGNHVHRPHCPSS